MPCRPSRTGGDLGSDYKCALGFRLVPLPAGSFDSLRLLLLSFPFGLAFNCCFPRDLTALRTHLASPPLLWGFAPVILFSRSGTLFPTPPHQKPPTPHSLSPPPNKLSSTPSFTISYLKRILFSPALFLQSPSALSLFGGSAPLAFCPTTASKDLLECPASGAVFLRLRSAKSSFPFFRLASGSNKDSLSRAGLSVGQAQFVSSLAHPPASPMTLFGPDIEVRPSLLHGPLRALRRRHLGRVPVVKRRWYLRLFLLSCTIPPTWVTQFLPSFDRMAFFASIYLFIQSGAFSPSLFYVEGSICNYCTAYALHLPCANHTEREFFLVYLPPFIPTPFFCFFRDDTPSSNLPFRTPSPLKDG